jgi:hypothetical protein
MNSYDWRTPLHHAMQLSPDAIGLIADRGHLVYKGPRLRDLDAVERVITGVRYAGSMAGRSGERYRHRRRSPGPLGNPGLREPDSTYLPEYR